MPQTGRERNPVPRRYPPGTVRGRRDVCISSSIAAEHWITKALKPQTSVLWCPGKRRAGGLGAAPESNAENPPRSRSEAMGWGCAGCRTAITPFRLPRICFLAQEAG